MPGPYTPSDTLIGAIVHQIALFISAQIPAVGHVYEDLPDRSPVDNSVIIPLIRGKVVPPPEGKFRIRLQFSLRHLFRRKNMPENIAQAYTFVVPWLKLLSAWKNQDLNGLAIEVDADELSVTQMSESGQPMVALVVNFFVVTEFNIDLT
jgi:hypothetical protein